MDHSNVFDALVAGFAFGNSIIGLGIMIRQTRNAVRQSQMHTQNQLAIASLHADMTEQHKAQNRG